MARLARNGRTRANDRNHQNTRVSRQPLPAGFFAGSCSWVRNSRISPSNLVTPMGFPHRFDNPMALPHAGVSRLQCGKKGKKSRKIRRLDIYNHLPADLYSAQYRIVPGHVESGKIKIESRKNLELFLSYGGTIVQHGRYHQHLNTLFGPSRIFRGVIPKPAAGL